MMEATRSPCRAASRSNRSPSATRSPRIKLMPSSVVASRSRRDMPMATLPNRTEPRPLGSVPKKSSYLLGRYAESAQEAAALRAIVPGLIEAGAFVLVFLGIRRHRVRQLGERLVPHFFVAADVVVIVESAGPDGHHRASRQLRRSPVD